MIIQVFIYNIDPISGRYSVQNDVKIVIPSQNYLKKIS